MGRQRRTRGMCHKPRDIWGYQNLEESRKAPLLWTSEGAWPSIHLDLGHVACRTVIGQICHLGSPSVWSLVTAAPGHQRRMITYIC